VQAWRLVALPPCLFLPLVIGRSVVLPRWSIRLVQAVWSVVLSAGLVVPVVLWPSVVLPRWSVLLVQVMRSVVLPPNPVLHVVLGRLELLGPAIRPVGRACPSIEV